jgi:hypothetical protein
MGMDSVKKRKIAHLCSRVSHLGKKEKPCHVAWKRGRRKFQAPNHKSQTNSKSENPMTKTAEAEGMRIAAASQSATAGQCEF